MTPSPSYLLKVTLKKTPRLIWRRFVVPSNTRLDRLHEILQTVMGWPEPRPHVFFHGKQGFYPTSQIPDGGQPEKKSTLSNLVVRSGGKLKYIVDPDGEKWLHEVAVESIRFFDPAWPFPIYCMEGVRSCPPLGVGGVDGFIHLLRVLDDPKHTDHIELTTRFGHFRPGFFDLASVNRAFGVEGPRPQTIERPKPKRAATTQRNDPLYRLGLKLKMAMSNGVE